jgi:hypothetical protein
LQVIYENPLSLRAPQQPSAQARPCPTHRLWTTSPNCRCRRLAALRAGVEEVIRRGHDHVLIIDLGPAESVAPKVTSLGKAFTGIERSPVIV